MAESGNLSAQSQPTMHIGEAIRKELERQGKTVVWLADELSYSRTNIYKIFNKPSIDTAVLRRISIALQIDFFKICSDDMEEHKTFHPQ